MLRMMLVDDEPIILERIGSMVVKSGRECEIVCTAGNGEEALERVRTYRPEIVFTDICMPIMDGIELARRLREEFPETVIVLISGFNEFSYAQQAISAGIFRYLLKPVASEELQDVLDSARRVLEVRQTEAEEKKRLQAMIRSQLPQLREKFFSDLIAGELDPDFLQQQLSFLEFEPTCESFGIILIQLDDFPTVRANLSENELQILKFRLLGIVREAFTGKIPFFFTFVHRPHEILCPYGLSGHQNPDELYQTLSDLQNRVNEGQNVTFSVGLGKLYPGLEQLGQSYQEAQLALEFKIWAGRNTIIHYSDIERSRSGGLLPLQGRDSLTAILREGSVDKAIEFIHGFFRSFGVYESTTKNLFYLAVLDQINQIIYAVMEFGGNPDQVFEAPFDPLKAVSSCETMGDLEKLVLNLSQKAVTFILGCKQNFSKGFVEKAKTYLEQHYKDPETSLGQVADHVYVSVSYLSHLFKQATGSTVTEYLSTLRIRAAQRLLKDSQLKIYEIAEAVGFNDSHYFGIAFKKATGLSPLEFRDKVQIDNLI